MAWPRALPWPGTRAQLRRGRWSCAALRCGGSRPALRRPPGLLRLVRTLPADAIEVTGLHARHVFATEAGAVEPAARVLRARHRALKVGEVLVDQPVAAEQFLDFLLAAAVGDQFVDRRHVDAVDVGMPHRRRRAGEV